MNYFFSNFLINFFSSLYYFFSAYFSFFFDFSLNFFFFKGFFFKKFFYCISSRFNIFYIFFFFSNNYKIHTFLVNFKTMQSHLKFFKPSVTAYSRSKLNLNNLGLKFFWIGLRFWIVPLLLSGFILYFLIFLRSLPFVRIFFIWFLLAMFTYWLISGFVFFFKKYQFSKYTSVIQRFWKRSYILFWLIEGGVFVVFFYLTINASSEPVYMYDAIKPFKNFICSWRTFIGKSFLFVLLLLISFFLIISNKWFSFTKSALILFFITLILIYVLWQEFYQFVYIIHRYSFLTEVFDFDSFCWEVETDVRRIRVARSYLSLCLLAKFWHTIFIFIFWIFFILRVAETTRIRYPLFSASVQNFIILYIMSWLYMYPWLRFIFRGFMSETYYWFFLNYRDLGFRLFFYDLGFFIFSVFSLHNFWHLNFFQFNSFQYWFDFNNLHAGAEFKKHILRDFIVLALKN